MDFNKNVYKLYVIIFFHNLIPAYVIERLFNEQRGMTVMMVVTCEIIYAATITTAEIPSGILADRFGRKKLLCLGAILSMLEFVFLLFAHRFIDFAYVAFMAGIAGACTSGASNALLYDSLLASGKEKQFEKVIGRMNALDFLAAILAALSGSLLATNYNFEINYILSAGSMLIALIFTFRLQEPLQSEGDGQEEPRKERFVCYFRSAIVFYKNSPQVAFLVVNAMAIGACVNYLDEFWQLYLKEIEFPIILFGLFSAIVSISRIPGNLISAYLQQFFEEENILLFVMAMISVGFFVIGIVPGWMGILGIITIFFTSGVVKPLIFGYLHHHASSNIRATVDSFQSLCERAISLIIGIGFGSIATGRSLTNGFLFLGFVCFIFLLSMTKKFYKQKIKPVC